MARYTQSFALNERRLNTVVYMSYYVLSSPDLLELDSLVDIDIETYGQDKLYVLKYKVSKEIKRIQFLSKNEPNIYRRKLQNGLYCVSFRILKKYNYIADLLYSSGIEALPAYMLHNSFRFLTKNLGCQNGSRGYFVIFHFQVISVSEVRCIFFLF